MKSFSDVYNRASNNGLSAEPDKENNKAREPADQKTKDIVNNLFSTLQSIFPANGYAWSNDKIVSNAKEQWLLALIENNVTTIEKIRYGVKKCRAIKSPFIPTPGEFIEFCKPDPKDFNLPTAQVAYDEALRRSAPCARNETWSHAVVYNAYKLTSSESLQRQGNYAEEKRVRNLFFNNYSMTVQKFINNEPIHDLPILIEHQFPEQGQATKIGSSALSNLMKGLK